MPSEETSVRLGITGWIVPRLVRTMIRIIRSTMFLTVQGVEVLNDLEKAEESGVIACFHGRQFLVIDNLRGRKLGIMSSLSRDGELQTRTLAGFGFEIVRGSASRGGAGGLIGLKKLMERGFHSAFAVDGPRGPLHVVKPGAVYLAKKMGASLLPVATSAKPAHIFYKTWDKYMMPFPFSRGAVLYGDPIYLNSDLSEKAIERDCVMLQEVLLRLQKEADRIVGY